MMVTFRCDCPVESAEWKPPNPRNPARWWMNYKMDVLPRVNDCINLPESSHDYRVKYAAWSVNKAGAHGAVHGEGEDDVAGLDPLTLMV